MQKISDNTAIIELYTALSKKFMSIMEKIGEAAEEERYQNGSKITC